MFLQCRLHPLSGLTRSILLQVFSRNLCQSGGVLSEFEYFLVGTSVAIDECTGEDMKKYLVAIMAVLSLGSFFATPSAHALQQMTCSSATSMVGTWSGYSTSTSYVGGGDIVVHQCNISTGSCVNFFYDYNPTFGTTWCSATYYPLNAQ